MRERGHEKRPIALGLKRVEADEEIVGHEVSVDLARARESPSDEDCDVNCDEETNESEDSTFHSEIVGLGPY